MLLRAFVFSAFVTLAAACTREPAPASSANGSQSVATSTGEGEGKDASTAALLGELTQAVRKFSAEQRRAPKTLDELVAQGYLNQVPPAPAGKAFAINKNLQVYLISQ